MGDAEVAVDQTSANPSRGFSRIERGFPRIHLFFGFADSGVHAHASLRRTSAHHSRESASQVFWDTVGMRPRSRQRPPYPIPGAPFGTCAVRDVRRSGRAPFGTCAVRDVRRLAPTPYAKPRTRISTDRTRI